MPKHAIEAAREQRAGLYEEMKELNDLAVGEKRDFTAEEQEKYERLETDFDAQTRSIQRQEKLEGYAPKATRSVVVDGEERDLSGDEEALEIKNYRDYVRRERGGDEWDTDEYRSQFYRWMQTGEQIDEQLRARVPHELRVQSKATGGAGANLVPTGFGELILAVERDLGSMLDVCKVINTDSGETINYPTVSGHGTAQWIAENGSYTASDDTFGQVPMGAYKDGTMVLVSEELATDNRYDLEGYLADELGMRIGTLLNTAAWIGDGSGKPTGLATTVTAGVTAAVGNTITIPADNLIDLVYSVKRVYRRNGQFALNDTSIKGVRKLKDSNNQYLWQTGLQAGQPDTLLGYPIMDDPDIPVPAANATPVMFGDFKRAYTVRISGTLFLQRLTERYADNGQIGFRAYQRFDGHQVNQEAVKAFKNSPT